MRTDFALLLFDLDDTLIDRVAMFRAFMRDHIAEYFPHHDYSRDLRAVLDLCTALDRRSYTPREELFRRLSEVLGPFEHSPRRFLEHWAAVAGQYALCYPETKPTLDALRSRYPLSVLTNGGEEGQNAKVDGAGLRPYFPRVFTSGGLGVAKPDPDAFLLVCRELNVASKDALYIGDYYPNDVLGAGQAGLTAVYLDRGDGPKHPHSIGNVGELPALLGLGEKPCAG